jgi:eukaryotic-like serine/threonine-protein kinase
MKRIWSEKKEYHASDVGGFGLRVLLLGCFFLAACSGAGESSTYRKQAEQFLSEGHLAEAVLTYQQALKSDPGDPDLLGGLGSALAAQGRDRSAALILEQAAAVKPEDAKIQEVLSKLETRPRDDASLKLAWFSSNVASEPLGTDIAAERVFVAYTNGQLLALDQGTGQLLWEARSPSALTSRPTADANQVWVGAEDGSVLVYNAATGQSLGEFTTHAAVFAAPALTPEKAFIASTDGTLYALDRSTLGLLWKAELGDALHASPLVSWPRVYVGCLDGRLYGFNVSTGERLWPYGIPTQGAVESIPVQFGDRLFFGSGDGRVYALDAETGGEYWRFSTPDSVYASPLVVNDQVFIASSGQVLASVQIADGAQNWATRFDHPLTEPPVLYKGKLYLAARGDPDLFVVDPQTGKILENLDTGDWIAQGPLAVGEDLLLVGMDGAVFLYR